MMARIGMMRALNRHGTNRRDANVDAAEKWFEENAPEGVAFEYNIRS
jgi:hypothetical protein